MDDVIHPALLLSRHRGGWARRELGCTAASRFIFGGPRLNLLQKRTSTRFLWMSALPPKADIGTRSVKCPLCAKSGHRQSGRIDLFDVRESGAPSEEPP